jgi:hypothetical protein
MRVRRGMQRIVSVMRGCRRGVGLGGGWLVSSRRCGDQAEVSGCVGVVVGDDEFAVLVEVCPSPVRVIGLSVTLCED